MAYFSSKWVILTFQVFCGQHVVIFIILKGFPESRKNWRFPWPRRMLFLGNSPFYIFLIQMSKYLPFKCPVVNWWWCSSVYKAFQKVEKKWKLSDRGPAEKWHFWQFTFLHISHPNDQIFIFQVSCGQLVVVFIILKGFPESWKH